MSLTPTTPALPNSEKDPVKIQAYKSKYPDVVDCLCLAAEWIEKPKEWIAQCDDFCTGTAAKKQAKVFKDFEV
ncbi:hypothetical protein BGW39_001210 [Mortierella sp. 14UC]|nr:hypothetical protein BGW39_001210 [Mortierella sp. 14UC]